MTQPANESSASTISRIKVPPARRPDAEEIERRRALFAEVMRLREQIGPIGIATDELVREARDEDEPVG